MMKPNVASGLLYGAGACDHSNRDGYEEQCASRGRGAQGAAEARFRQRSGSRCLRAAVHAATATRRTT